jgi:SAM-dependent methyltransferase
MGQLRNFITPLHKRTVRDHIGRMMDEKAKCMTVAKKFGRDFWDGDRRYGYGGYAYRPGYYEPMARALIETYHLTDSSAILDVGCGKAFLLYELHKLLPGARIAGFDISEYAIANAKEEIRDKVFVHRAEEPYPYKAKEFDLIISVTTLHNLKVFDLKRALQEIARVGKRSYVAVESFRNDLELFNCECWALTCQAFFSVEEWTWLFKEFGCDCDYEFIYFE